MTSKIPYEHVHYESRGVYFFTLGHHHIKKASELIAYAESANHE